MPLATLERRDAVAIVSLDRAERLNAISFDLLGDLIDALDRAADDPMVRVILLRAEGRAFCAGDDLAEFIEGFGKEKAHAFIDRLQAVTRRIMLGTKPVVCAIQGAVVGGGAAWPVNADVAIAADDTILFCPEAAFGLFPTGGMSMLLDERCGPARATDILWLGERLDAHSLLREKIVSRVVARPMLEEAALAVADRLTTLPPESLARFKAARVEDIGLRLDVALARESRHCLVAGDSPEVRARVHAYLEGGR
ncbi:enoyl-CoA hydratase/isomerase family protein [Sphingomonas sp. QA11]|uniref:enoyl-CoA hydratase/isomerase family protein n=1 Tax=Sphingomonas sp. QA11 TaxID=2950605 RepID=UPI00234AB07C|nr:enoyl-CoA hydratase/isomerase family protein [Sphingomonas sp. QA11]WCM28472.1 enoyl-CoA hydratase/isomerase family protein [Sphingomonas sp. QA11]